MKLISRDMDYSITVLKYIDDNKGKVVSTKEIVEHLDIPREEVRKIVLKLSKSGIIESYKGRGGGVRLKSDLKKVTLLQIIEIFGGKFKINECKFLKKSCPFQKNCKLRIKLLDIEKDLLKKFSKICLTEI